MKHALTKYLLLIFFSNGIYSDISAEIKSPNYDFSTKTLEPFFPGKGIEENKKNKSIQSDIFEDNGNLKTWRFKVNKGDYKLDVYTQVKDDKIIDMFVRLPQHFSHDLLLADLQKRYKKQDAYARKDGSALYTWLNRDGNNILYQGSCSITCFPMFLEISGTDKAIIPFSKKMDEALFPK